jgi:hypothetical protein
MSGEKARTTIQQIWTWIQNHRSDVIVGLLVLNTMLLVVSFFVHTTSHDVEQVLQREHIRELGGQANYDRYQEIISSDAYRQQQTFLIDQQHKSFFPHEYQSHEPDTLSGSGE